MATRRRASAFPALALAAAFAWFAPGACAAADVKLPKPTSKQREELIHRARVWEATDVGSKDLYNGPPGKLKFAVGQEVTCDFVPKALPGWSHKFLCRLDDGNVVKVKYVQGDRFKEVYGEVLGTRLFWALGFYADKMLPLRVVCRGCPKQPWTYVNERKNRRKLDAQGMVRSFPPEAELGTYVFDPAAIEEKLDAEPIETHHNEGWSWAALAKVDATHGGASRAELDAFKLLNAFVQNADNAHEQNALVCPRDAVQQDAAGHVTCGRPVMYVDDLGAVFGKGGGTTWYDGRVDYEGWKARRVWRKPASCRARLAAIGFLVHPTCLSDPVVGEEGRALLARLLSQLSDAQIRDLFKAARIQQLHRATVEDWVTVFKEKRDEIVNHPGCPAAD